MGGRPGLYMNTSTGRHTRFKAQRMTSSCCCFLFDYQINRHHIDLHISCNGCTDETVEGSQQYFAVLSVCVTLWPASVDADWMTFVENTTLCLHKTYDDSGSPHSVTESLDQHRHPFQTVPSAGLSVLLSFPSWVQMFLNQNPEQDSHTDTRAAWLPPCIPAGCLVPSLKTMSYHVVVWIVEEVSMPAQGYIFLRCNCQSCMYTLWQAPCVSCF